MRVAMYYNNSDVRLEELPRPKPLEGELLIRIEASGICGTDVLEWYRRKHAPAVLGHELAGEVVEVGDSVDHFRPGDRVVATHHVPCKSCHYCRRGHASVCELMRQTSFDPGGFAEYLRVPKVNVAYGTFRLPNHVSYAEGSFVEPLGCVVRALRLAELKARDSVLIIGCGVAGLLHAQLAHRAGARPIVATDINPNRLEMATALGAHKAIEATADVAGAVRSINDGRLADLVILCTGASAAVRQAFQSVERGGRVLFFAPTPEGTELPVPLYDLWRNEISLTTSYAASPEDMNQAINLLEKRWVRVEDLISHRLSLAETGMGFQLVAGAKDSLKVIIEPQRP